MMASRVSMRHKRKQAPQWVFPWRAPRQSPLPKISAILISLALFAVLFGFLRIRVAPPIPWAVNKATVFRVIDDTDGRALTLQAREGGPFPSRFQPSEAGWLRDLEASVLSAAGWQAQPYMPRLRELPAIEPPPPVFSSPGDLVLPRRTASARVPVTGKSKTVPLLYPLAGLVAGGLPASLPEFTGEIPPAMRVEPWRFLLRLNARGRVRDIVPLAGGGEDAGLPALIDWLRLLDFPSDDGSGDRWVAVGLGFINQTADGTDAD
jgi:hypothetical protein